MLDGQPCKITKLDKVGFDFILLSKFCQCFIKGNNIRRGIFKSNIYAQLTGTYPYFGLTSIGPSWAFDGSGSPAWIITGITNPLYSPYYEIPFYNDYINGGFFGETGYGGWNGQAIFANSGITDFGNFGFGFSNFSSTGALGGFGSPVPIVSPVRPFGTFGVNDSVK